MFDIRGVVHKTTDFCASRHLRTPRSIAREFPPTPTDIRQQSSFRTAPRSHALCYADPAEAQVSCSPFRRQKLRRLSAKFVHSALISMRSERSRGNESE